jgi:hypothetical protein
MIAEDGDTEPPAPEQLEASLRPGDCSGTANTLAQRMRPTICFRYPATARRRSLAQSPAQSIAPGGRVFGSKQSKILRGGSDRGGRR